MIRTRSILATAATLAVLGGLGLAGPSSAAAPKKFEGVIAIPAIELASELGGEGLVGAGNISCPDGGPLDGVVYKWFDLKTKFTKFKAYGPESLFPAQPLPENPVASGNAMSYDIDMWAFDDKCVRVEPTRSGDGGSFGGVEQMTTRKPVRYIAITYYTGLHVNLPVTVEAS